MWSRATFAALCDPPLIGMVHLGALPGAPGRTAPIAEVARDAAVDAAALVAGGVTAIMVENFHDVPFYRDRVPPETVAALAVIVADLRRRLPRLAIGVNVLRNDAAAALGIAAATGAAFVRVNVHAGAAVTDQGLIQGDAARTLRRRRALALDGRRDGAGDTAPGVGILADLRVKHAQPLGELPAAAGARDLRRRGLADAVIVTGAATGEAADRRELAAVRAALPDCPVLVGSGVDADNIADYAELADGFIVGSALQEEAGDRRRISTARTERLIAAWRAAPRAAGSDQRSRA